MSKSLVTPRLRGLWLSVGMLTVAGIAGGLAGCGGGGGYAGVSPFPAPAADAPAPSPAAPPGPSQPLAASSTYARHCVTPRPAATIDPNTGAPYGDQLGNGLAEKNWVRAWIDETYLWFDEVPALKPANYVDAVSYFNDLKTPAITASGKPKDQFHFTYNTLVWTNLSNAGIEAGYGMEIALLSEVPPRSAVVAYTDPGTPATDGGMRRGARIVTVDGVDVANGSDVDALNAGLFPSDTGQLHTFGVLDPGAATPRSVSLRSAQIAKTPVQNVKTIGTAAGKVGYLQFNDHIATSEAQLIAAIRQLNAAGPIADLVLDIRYNGGGLLGIASELAYMVAGNARTAGKTFERLDFNSKNPFGLSLDERTTPFYATAQGFSATIGNALPSLGLGRVFVLTGAGTCSASEAIMNGLRGAGVQVIQIGETTCGKPYGFLPADNCGTTYFAIQFKGVNNAGFGDYADGFVPNGSGGSGVPGCVVSDDFDHALGDPAEARLSTALSYQVSGSCPAHASSRESAQALAGRPAEPRLVRSALRENRFYRAR